MTTNHIVIGPRWRHIRWALRAAGIMLAYAVMFPTLCVRARGFVGPVEVYRCWPTTAEVAERMEADRLAAAKRREARARDRAHRVPRRDVHWSDYLPSDRAGAFERAGAIERHRLGLDYGPTERQLRRMARDMGHVDTRVVRSLNEQAMTKRWESAGFRLGERDVQVSTDGAWVRLYNPWTGNAQVMTTDAYHRMLRRPPYAG